jgi:hypothetical protein
MKYNFAKVKTGTEINNTRIHDISEPINGTNENTPENIPRYAL